MTKQIYKKNIQTDSKVIIALDFAEKKEALNFLDMLFNPASEEINYGDMPYVKVGMELFYSSGPEIVREIKKRGYKVFLDLKLHDIPNTVGRSMETLTSLGVDMINCHAGGGTKMMEAAIEGLEKGTQKGSIYTEKSRPLLIAVTQLTSTDEKMLHNELMIAAEACLEDAVIQYACNAKKSGLDGVVCSPLEAESIHKKLGSAFLTVTPGIRFTSSERGKNDDQQRVATPEEAGRLGSDFIVVGRPITRAKNPQEAYRKCKEDFERGRKDFEEGKKAKLKGEMR